MRKYVLPLAILFVFALAATGQAQEQGQIGVTMGYPASIGIIYHPTDGIAIRPDFTFATSSSDTNNAGGVISSGSGTSVGFGASALFYVRTWEHLRVYVSPRFGYTRTTSSSTSGSASVTSSSENTGNTYTVSGTIGGQYGLSRRFAVYGETGFGYTRQTTSATGTSTITPPGVTNSSSTEGHSNNWGMRAGVGAVLYF